MNKIDIVKSAAVSPNNRDDKSYLYADDFQSTDSIGSPPWDKSAWLAMTPLMVASFPDFEYVIEEIKEEGDGVRLTGHFVGTFTNALDLSAMGMGVIPASRKKITWPTSQNLITVEGEKITRWHNLDTGPDAGLPGFVKAMGAG